MKNIILLLTLLTASICTAQEQKLFNIALKWVEKTYDNPEEVIIWVDKDERVIIEGFEDNLVCVRDNCFYALYTIKIEVVEDKLDFLPMEVFYHIPYKEPFEGVDLQFSIFKNLQNFSEEDYQRTTKKVLGLYKELEDDLQAYLYENK